MNYLHILALLVLANCQPIITDNRGNMVQGQGNTWNGEQNKIKGAENQVIGDQNRIQGSSNIVRGSGNVVGDMSSAQIAALQKQMTDRISGRFGNIFSRFSSSAKPAAPKAQSTVPTPPSQPQAPKPASSIPKKKKLEMKLNEEPHFSAFERLFPDMISS